MSKRNRIRNMTVEQLSNEHRLLEAHTFDYERDDGSMQVLNREIYHVDDGATGLPYDPERRTVLLVRQFRLPSYLRGEEGWLLEAPAGFMDNAPPEERVREEIAEEAGYRVGEVTKVFEASMIPSCVTHVVYGFIAKYSPADRINSGGGLVEEGEDIEVVELTIDRAMEMVAKGEIIDAKTIMLLQHLALFVLR